MSMRAWFDMAMKNPLWVGLGGVILGALLNKFLPFLWSSVLNFGTWLLGRFGGRLAHRHLEKQLMNWTVMQLRELKLTGIVSSDNAKKPTLEQVFVSLRLAERDNQNYQDDTLDAFLSKFPLVPAEAPHQLERLMALVGRLERLNAEDLNTLEELLTEKLQSREYRELLHGLPIRKQVPHLLWCAAQKLFDRSLLRKSRLDPVEVNVVTTRRIRWRARALFQAVQLNDPDLNTAFFKRILRHTSRLAILGGPGAGKTTLLQYVALSYARARAGDPKLRRHALYRRQLGASKWRLPIYISLGSAAPLLAELKAQGHAPALLEILPKLMDPELRREHANIAPAYFRRRIVRGDCVFLLDGLDEVPSDIDFEMVVTAIESLAVRHPGNQFIVTSRIAGWRSGVEADFRKYYVDDLTDKQIATFVETWYEAVERNAVVGLLQEEGAAERESRLRRAQTRASELKSALRQNSGIRKLATNPMLLSIIAMVHRSLATLPRERAKLYDQCTRILLEQWDISRGVRVDDTGLKLEQKEAVMRRLAFDMHRGEIGDSAGAKEASRADVEAAIGSLLPGMGRSEDEAAQLLRRLMERSGLIIERRRDILGFAHLTFQEYFAAQSLTADHPARAVSFLTNPIILFNNWWREVLLLYSGLQSDSGSLLQAILSNPSDRLELRAKLAGLCYLESVQVKDAAVRETLESLLLQLRLKHPIQINGHLPVAVREYLVEWVSGEIEPASVLSSFRHSFARHITDSIGLDSGDAIEARRARHSNSRARIERNRHRIQPGTTSLSEDFVLRAAKSRDWELREAGAAAIGEIQPTQITISAAATLVADADSAVRAAAKESLQRWLATAPDTMLNCVDALLGSADPQALAHGLRIVASLNWSGEDVRRIQQVLALLGHADKDVISAAGDAFKACANGPTGAALLLESVTERRMTITQALRVATAVKWNIDDAQRTELEKVMATVGENSFIAAAILSRSDVDQVRRNALQHLILSDARAEVRQYAFRALDNGRRGDLNDSLEAELIRIVKANSRSSFMAAVCLGRSSRCTSQEQIAYTLRTVLMRRGRRPFGRWRVQRENHVAQYTRGLLEGGREGIDLALPISLGLISVGPLVGLVDLGRDCDVDAIASIMAEIVDQHAHIGVRHAAAAALTFLPIGSADDVYPKVIAFYRSSSTNDRVRRSRYMLDESSEEMMGGTTRHPLVILAGKLNPQLLEIYTLELLRDKSRTSRVIAFTIIIRHQRDWSTELYQALAVVLHELSGSMSELLGLALEVARTLLVTKAHSGLLDAVTMHLRSDERATQEMAWEIVLTQHLRAGHWEYGTTSR
jgi:hypothetical protein